MTETLKIALYGKYGTRKTLQIGNLIDTYGADKVFIVSIESGLNTIGNKPIADHIFTVDSPDDMRKAWGWANKNVKLDSWLCCDGMSRIMHMMSNAELSGADKYFELIASGDTHNEIADELKPYGRYMTDRGKMDTMRIYGKIGRDAENLLTGWISLKCNLYCSYLEDMTSNGTEKTIPWTPHVPGNVGLRAVMSSFDYVMRLAYAKDSKGEQVLTAGLDPASAVYLARTREDRTRVDLPKAIENFNLGDFTRKLRGDNAV